MSTTLLFYNITHRQSKHKARQILLFPPEFFVQPLLLPAFENYYWILSLINIGLQFFLHFCQLHIGQFAFKYRILNMGHIFFTGFKNMRPPFTSIVVLTHIIHHYHIHFLPPYSEPFVFFFSQQMLYQFIAL